MKLLPLLALLAIRVAAAQEGPAYRMQLEGFNYPWPVALYRFESQGQALEMAYMDVKPGRPNGRTAVLLHGKNFCAATWEGTITALTGAGYRVIAPDQIGFCKSSKPEKYQFTFQQLAGNTHALLESLGVRSVTIVGHSTGGMLGVRYALMYPSQVEHLALVDPIGLEDWKARGVPWQSVDTVYRRELETTAERIRSYERATYYAGTWEPTYERWVQMLAGMYRGSGRARVAWDSALLHDMIYTQPIVYELGALRVPVLLIIGDKDTTAIGKDLVSPQIRATLGNYPELAKKAAAQIPHAKLIEFADLGHSPQIQAPERFHKALLDGLASRAVGTTSPASSRASRSGRKSSARPRSLQRLARRSSATQSPSLFAGPTPRVCKAYRRSPPARGPVRTRHRIFRRGWTPACSSPPAPFRRSITRGEGLPIRRNQAPELAVTDIQGKPATLAGFKGKPYPSISGLPGVLPAAPSRLGG